MKNRQKVDRCELCRGTDFEEYVIVVNKTRKRNFVDYNTYKKRRFVVEKTFKECLGCHDRKIIKKEEIFLDWEPKPKMQYTPEKKFDIDQYGLT